MTKDETLKMAIEALETAEIQSEYDGLSNLIFKAIQACKEALEQQEIGDAEIKQMLDNIQWYQMRVKELEEELEALEQPAMTYEQGFAHGYEAHRVEQQEPLNLNCKSVQKRLATQWGYVEQPAQEPVAWYWNNNHRDNLPFTGVERGNPKMDVIYGTPIPLYTHPALSWQELSDVELSLLAEKYTGADGLDVVDYGRAVMQAYGKKNHV